jgi:hypothetical protein
MNANNVYSKITEFAEKTEKRISVNEFIDLLKTTSRTNKMNIVWFTEGSADGSGKPPHQSKHLMWWDDSEYVGGAAGGSDTKALQQQFNLQTTGGEWITLSYENIISMSYKGRIYIVE